MEPNQLWNLAPILGILPMNSYDFWYYKQQQFAVRSILFEYIFEETLVQLLIGNCCYDCSVWLFFY